MISDTTNNFVIYAKNNTQATGHPFWSILGGYVDDHSTESSVCADDDYSDSCSTKSVCDFTLEYSDLDALTTAKTNGAFPDVCTDYYALGALGTMLDGAMTDYAGANSGYDGVFGDYVSSMIPFTG
jgi:glucan 1,3-beta-glucosidase